MNYNHIGPGVTHSRGQPFVCRIATSVMDAPWRPVSTSAPQHSTVSVCFYPSTARLCVSNVSAFSSYRCRLPPSVSGPSLLARPASGPSCWQRVWRTTHVSLFSAVKRNRTVDQARTRLINDNVVICLHWTFTMAMASYVDSSCTAGGVCTKGSYC